MREHPPVRWGIVGFGWVAQDYLAPALVEAGDRLVAICDPDPRARNAARALDTRVHETLDELATDPYVEAVYVATPNDTHRALVETLAAAGKAILCEKPMAPTLADAHAMVDACRRAGIFYRTAFDQRHHPAHILLRDALSEGRIGLPTAVRIVYACWVGPDWADGSARENWRIDRARAGGGALIDLAPHGLDLATFLIGEPIVEIRALTQSRVQAYDVDDGAILIGRTAGGVLVTVHVAYNCPEGLPRRRLEIVGSTGMFVAQDTMGQTAGGHVTHIDGATGYVTPCPIENVSPFVNQICAFGREFRKGVGSDAALAHDLHIAALVERAYANARAAIV